MGQVKPAHAGSASQAQAQDTVVDDIGGQDAFVSGMIYALSRRITPGDPYTPSAVSRDGNATIVRGAEPDRERDREKWRLEECLRWAISELDMRSLILFNGIYCYRFATELAGRKARRKGWDGMAEEMAKAGWFDG